jgi:two-component sensor histidine kinase
MPLEAAAGGPDEVERGRGQSKRRQPSLRREYLRLLIAVQLPLLLLALVQSAGSWRERQAAQADRLAENARAVAAAERSLLDWSGAILRMLARDADAYNITPMCTRRLREVHRDIPGVANVVRVDGRGVVVCSAVPARAGLTYAAVSWWPQVVQADGVAVHGPVMGTITGKQVLLAMLPLRASDGTFLGALGVAIDVARLQQAVKARQLSDNAVVAIVDDAGAVLAKSRPDSRLPAFDMSGPPGGVKMARSAASGREWTYAHAPLFASAGSGRNFHAVFAEPHDEIFSAAWWRAGFIFLLPVLTVLLGSLAIWRGTDRLVLRWLGRLSGLAREFAQGTYRARVPGLREAPAEIRDFAADLHRMAHAIEDRDVELTRALAQEKELVREVHHRVRNNLQVMMSMLSLQAARLPGGTTRAALDEARIRMGALALVHTLAYESGEQGRISTARLLPALCARLQSEMGARGVRLAAEVSDIEIGMDTAVPLALWLSEAAMNALRHAYPDGEGEVRVGFTCDDGLCRLEVADDGRGLDGAAGERYGMRLLDAIARQLGGRSWVESSDGGTRLKLEFRERPMGDRGNKSP